MARRTSRNRKQRTREHVIADLAVNFVERQVLLCGFTTERIARDYGLDLILFTYDPDGYEERGPVFFQVKATDRLQVRKGGSAVAFRVERADLESWIDETMPVMLIVYDAQDDNAYWLYVQAWFQSHPLQRRSSAQTVTLTIPRSQRLDTDAVQQFRKFKQDVRAQSQGSLITMTNSISYAALSHLLESLRFTRQRIPGSHVRWIHPSSGLDLLVPDKDESEFVWSNKLSAIRAELAREGILSVALFDRWESDTANADNGKTHSTASTQARRAFP